MFGLGFLGGSQAGGGDALFRRKVEDFNFELLFAGERFRLGLVILADADTVHLGAGDAVGGGSAGVIKGIDDILATGLHAVIMAILKAIFKNKVIKHNKTKHSVNSTMPF